MPDDLPVLEALHSTPSRRYLAPDPVPEDVLWAILDAAIRGPSGGNSQQWGWVDALTMALIPMGYPSKGRWAQPRRRPVEEVVHWNRWGVLRAQSEAGT